MMALPPDIVDRLAKICGLLGSDQDGERAAAAWHASQILFEHKLTWRDLIQAAGSRHDAPIRFEPTPSWRDRVDECLGCHWRFTEWELEFLRSLAVRYRPPSPKQEAVLARLHSKATQP